MHLILTGATGTVGNAVLHECLASPKVTRLSILSRREFALPTGENLDTAKAEIIVHSNYTEYPTSLLDKLKGSDGCIWAQGISQTQVSKEEYLEITHDYPLAAAKAFSSLSKNLNFVYVSGEGADVTEKTYMLFGKIKGRTEKQLLALNLPSLRAYNVRPAHVIPPVHHRPRPLIAKVLDVAMIPLSRRFAPALLTPTDALSRVLVDLATGNGEPLSGDGIEAEGRTLRNTAIRRLAGL